MTAENSYTLAEIATRLKLQLRLKQTQSSFDESVAITGVATLSGAGAGQISFYHNSRYFQDLQSTRATAVILREEHADASPVSCLIADNPYVAYAQLTQLFDLSEAANSGIHPTAQIASDAKIAPSAWIGPNVVVGAGCQIGERCTIGANSVMGNFCQIGDDCKIAANVTFYTRVVLAARVIVHAGVVLGADGFGFASDGTTHHKIAQLGGVQIGEDVEIGAGTTIDRGALDDTIIESGVKIDNQVQIAHNVIVGSNTIICGCSAIAGSSVIGKNCIIAGAVGIINHVSICDGVTVTAMSLVNQSITKPGYYSSGTGLDKAGNWKKNIVRFKQLDEIWKKLLRLEKKL